MKKYIFDVDGTLTPSRERINKQFGVWFSKFCQENNVYLVTGSDRAKTIEQVGEFICFKCKRVYNCSGNDVYQGDSNIRTSEWKIPNDLKSNLNLWLNKSKFPIRAGQHIEERPGSVNFSVVGRGASQEERSQYVKWDLKTNERIKISKKINILFPNITASVGGETGLDIYPKGNDKSQILKDFSSKDVIYFFGDKMDKDGNDYPLAKELKHPSKSFCVDNWEHTFKILKELKD